MFSLLREAAYLRYWLAVVVSFIGDGITRTAVIYLVARITNDPFMIGLAIFAQMVPTAVLGIFMGPMIDRLPRRWLMIAADLYRLAIVLLLIPAQHSPLLVVALVVLQGIGTAVFEPARVASVPQLVGEKRIPQAVALFQGTVSAIGLIAPSIAGLLLTAQNVSLIFILDAATYLVSASLLYSLSMFGKLQEQNREQRESYWQSLQQGIRRIIAIPSLRFLLLLLMPIMLAGGMFMTNFKAILLHSFQVPAFHYGLLEGAFGGGAILGAMVGPMLVTRIRQAIMLVLGAGLFGAAMISVFPLEELRLLWGLSIVYVWCAVMGLSQALLNFPLGSLFLQLAPAELRGRGFALFQSAITISYIAGVLVGGVLGNVVGVPASIVTAGIVMLTTALVYPFLKSYKAVYQFQQSTSAS